MPKTVLDVLIEARRLTTHAEVLAKFDEGIARVLAGMGTNGN